MRIPSSLLLVAFALGCSSTTTINGADASPDRAADVSVTDASTDATGDGGACVVGSSGDPLVVPTERGLVRGAMEGDAIHWLGIPYAAPPVASLRWRPPQPSACWNDTRDATMWAPACPQIPQQQGQAFDPMAPVVGQEDCLTLNVWRPASAPTDAALPVMVFVHGGGNVVGSANERTQAGVPLFDGTRLAARGNVVVVTMQYRLGPLGWLSHPALDAENNGAPAGNLALLDQIAALRWVQRNVRAFRGDPSKVMLFGESAGGINTCALLASPAAAGLFQRALIQSGSCTATQTLTDARNQTQRFVEGAGCATASDVLACLRGLGAEAVVRALPAPVNVSGLDPNAVRWGPVVGGAAMPERPFDALLAGRHNRVAVVVGHNTEEVGLTVPAIPTEMAYRAALTSVGGATFADAVIARYPVATYGTPRAALVQALTDARFGCQARLSARAAARGQMGNPAVYRYLYGHALQASTATARALGAWHGLELLYVFQNVAQGMLTPTADDLAVERAMLGYWTRFAATGDPNGNGATVWPAYASGEPLLRLGATATVDRGWRGSECDAWDALIRTSAPAP